MTESNGKNRGEYNSSVFFTVTGFFMRMSAFSFVPSILSLTAVTVFIFAVLFLYASNIFIVIMSGPAALDFYNSVFEPCRAYASEELNLSRTGEVRLIDVINMALVRNPDIKIYKSERISADADILSNESVFDAKIKTSAGRSIEYTPLSGDKLSAYRRSGVQDMVKFKQGSFSYTAGYEKKYRSGISISPDITVYTGESNDPQGRGPFTNGKVQFTIIKPLGAGGGSKINTAFEKSAHIESESVSLDGLHIMSQTVRDAVYFYWNYAYAYKALKITEESKKRAERIYNDNKILVENNEAAPAELDTLIANLNSRLAECEKASQTLLEARNNLKTALGVSIDSDFASAPPADFFPAGRIAVDTVEISMLAERLVKYALINRKDYAAARKRLESYNYTIPAAEDALKPQADLKFTAGYNTLKEDKGAAAVISSLHEGASGVNISAVVNYSFPAGNNSARADLIKRREQLERARIKADDMARRIEIKLNTRINAIFSITNRYGLMLESSRLYAKALENEKEKHQMGAATLMDILNLEDRLGQAELALEAAVFEYASTITDLRFDAGCLISSENSCCEIKLEDLTVLPGADELVNASKANSLDTDVPDNEKK